MRRADVLAGRQQVLHLHGQQRVERNLKRQRRKADVVVACTAGMKIDVIATLADRVFESGSADFVDRLTGHQTPILSPHVFFQHGEACPDPA